ncbi:ABC transporter substrate-binding protein [Azospirillum sp. RWY-5-1]|uniref:ABC transporter substrate-binding protein n=1 Tax=Azospirillum oleiclasticum TaxID=2735135 RepID=A0ABX2TEB8_9PROT|nr:ABC transporter substrate-binding protein [Azospirillum oleiclasticum]NYZ14914.1 ABC transporter substrate-binding protein [Azospirillum oleiclasticum]NYZ22676.1 ABC transporter substrate-binding protein [Azospirillum oleiclasticum]
MDSGNPLKAMRVNVLLILFISIVSTPAFGEPRRVVSMNLCADQLLVLLADRPAILSLSPLSRDPVLSYVAPLVKDLPQNHGMAEEIYPLKPDLVLAGSHTARPTVAFLKSRGIPVLELSIPRDFNEIRDQLRRVADALGRTARGEELITAMDRLLDEVPARAGSRPLALAWQAGGFTAGTGTLTDAVFEAAGVENLAARSGLAGYGYIGLETVVAGRPDLLVSEHAMPGRPSLQQALLQHPALADGSGIGHRIDVPSALTACGGPFTAEAVRIIRQASEP